MTDRYNLNGDKIKVVKCNSCGHEVDVSQLASIHVNGLRYDVGLSLIVADKFAYCCDNSTYSHIY